MENIVKNIRLIILDVDGTLTDGGIQIDNNGIESKTFNVKDGFGIVSASKLGINFAIITGRTSLVVEKRAKELGIKDLYQGIHNKIEKIDELLTKYKLDYSQCAYMGDDINDISAMEKVALVGVPADAVSVVKEYAHFISKANGGKGAVREFIDYILKNQGLDIKILDQYKSNSLED